MFEGLLQPTHLILILAITLVIFGPGKMAETGAALGKGLRDFRRALRETDDGPARAAPPACSSCGRVASAGDRFCPACGATLPARDPTTAGRS